MYNLKSCHPSFLIKWPNSLDLKWSNQDEHLHIKRDVEFDPSKACGWKKTFISTMTRISSAFTFIPCWLNCHILLANMTLEMQFAGFPELYVCWWQHCYLGMRPLGPLEIFLSECSFPWLDSIWFGVMESSSLTFNRHPCAPKSEVRNPQTNYVFGYFGFETQLFCSYTFPWCSNPLHGVLTY